MSSQLKKRPDRDWIFASQDHGKKYLRGTDGDATDLVASGENEAKLPIITGTAYSGGILNVGFGWPVVVDLAGASVSLQTIPIHREHDRDRLVGHTESIDLAATKVKFKGVISGVGEDAEEVKGTARNGFPWRPSIGASFQKLEYVDREQTVKVNGRNFSGPIYIARGSVIRELSVVTVPGDDKSDAAIAAKLQESEMNEFELWLQANGFDPATVTPQQKIFLTAQFEASKKAPPPTPPSNPNPAPAPNLPARDDLFASMRKELLSDMRAEESRLTGIRAAFGGEHPEEMVRAIKDPEYTPEKAELFVVRASRPKAPSLSSENLTLSTNTIHAAMCRNQGVKSETLEKLFGKDATHEAQSSRYDGYGIQAMMETHMVLAGFSWHHGHSRKSSEYMHRAKEAETKLKASGFATVSLNNALQSVVRALLIDSYGSVLQSWRHFCGIRNHSDFKIVKYYRMDASGSIREVGPDGQLPSLSLTASEYSNQLKTYGGTLTLTRQDRINDDIGMFGQMPKVIGREFSNRIDESIYKFLLALFAGGTFFHANKRNKKTGAGSALSYAALSASAAAFGSLLDAKKKPFNTVPASRLTTPLALQELADNFFDAEKVIIAGSTDKERLDKNSHKGKYRNVSSTWLDNTDIRDQDGAALTGQSATRWMMHGDPAVAAPVYVAFLNGQEQPTIQEAITPADILGEAVQFFHDWGVGAGDEYSAIENVGA